MYTGSTRCAPVAQLDRAAASGAVGREFESLRAHHAFVFALSKIRADSHTEAELEEWLCKGSDLLGEKLLVISRQLPILAEDTCR